MLSNLDWALAVLVALTAAGVRLSHREGLPRDRRQANRADWADLRANGYAAGKRGQKL